MSNKSNWKFESSEGEQKNNQDKTHLRPVAVGA